MSLPVADEITAEANRVSPHVPDDIGLLPEESALTVGGQQNEFPPEAQILDAHLAGSFCASS